MRTTIPLAGQISAEVVEEVVGVAAQVVVLVGVELEALGALEQAVAVDEVQEAGLPVAESSAVA